MRLQRLSNGQPVFLDRASPLGAGGEARIYAVRQEPGLAAKVYHRQTEEYGRKLAVMLANPPEDPHARPGQLAIAWPIDLLCAPDAQGRIVGYLMPRVSKTFPIFTFYNPSARRQQTPLATYLTLHRTARNLAAAVRALHTRGYVIGDVNESNILVSESALVTLVDTDSFQVRDPQSDAVYRCPVGKPDFTPPELQGKTFLQTDRTPEQDLFGLAVLIFQLLLEGTHPFAGVYMGSGDPPSYDARILAGHFPYGTRPTPYRPMPAAPPFTLLHPTVQRLFIRCFEDGYRDPKARPDTLEWQRELLAAEEALTVCSVNAQHRYGTHLETCPWCARKDQLGGRDPFPSMRAVRTGQHLPATPRRTPPPARPSTSPASSTPYNPMAGRISRTAPFTPSGSAGGGWAYSAPPASASVPAPVFNVPRNPWAWGALGLALLAALLSALRLPLGLLALAGGAVGWLAGRRRPALGGRPLAVGAAALGAILAVGQGIAARLPHSAPVLSVGNVRALAVSPDSRTLATGTGRVAEMSNTIGAAALWDAQTGEAGRLLANFQGDVPAVAFSPDNRFVAVGTMPPLGPGRLLLWDTRAEQWRWNQLAHADSIGSVAFARDGRRLASGGYREFVRNRQVFGEVKVWDVMTGALLQTFEGAGEVFSVAFSPGGRYVAVGSGSGASSRTTELGKVSLWDTQTGSLLWSHPAHSTAAMTVAFSPDGRTLASGGADNAVRLWEIPSGRLLRSLETPSLWIAAVALSPDSRTVACGGSAPDIFLWDAQTAALKRTLTGHKNAIRALVFSPDGKTLFSGSKDGTVRLWPFQETSASGGAAGP